MEMTHADFQHACRVMLGELQENPNCDTRLVHLLCEGVRCSRECCDLAKMSLQVPNDADQRRRAKDARKEARRFRRPLNPPGYTTFGPYL